MEFTSRKMKEHIKPRTFFKKNIKYGGLIVFHVGYVRFRLKAQGFLNY